jgi:hypothetical protein
MKNRLTERDLSRIVRRVIGNESRKRLNEMTYDLRTDIMDIIRDSNASNEEVISILNSIADEMSSSRRLRRDVENRFRGGMNEEDEKDMDQHINWDIKDVDCEGGRFGKLSSMGVSYDDDHNPEVFIRYCKGDNEELDYLKRKARMEIESYLF